MNILFLIMGAMATMPNTNENYTNSGLPDANKLSAIIGIEVSAKQRNDAWASYQTINPEQKDKAIAYFNKHIAEQGKLNEGNNDNNKTSKSTGGVMVSAIRVERRCRAGWCFGGVAVEVSSPTKGQLKAWNSDEFLKVETL